MQFTVCARESFQMPDMSATAIVFSLSQVVLSLLLLLRIPAWGFRSLSSFNKVFKETQGLTPTAWRKSQLQK